MSTFVMDPSLEKTCNKVPIFRDLVMNRVAFFENHIIHKYANYRGISTNGDPQEFMWLVLSAFNYSVGLAVKTLRMFDFDDPKCMCVVARELSKHTYMKEDAVFDAFNGGKTFNDVVNEYVDDLIDKCWVRYNHIRLRNEEEEKNSIGVVLCEAMVKDMDENWDTSYKPHLPEGTSPYNRTHAMALSRFTYMSEAEIFDKLNNGADLDEASPEWLKRPVSDICDALDERNKVLNQIIDSYVEDLVKYNNLLVETEDRTQTYDDKVKADMRMKLKMLVLDGLTSNYAAYSSKYSMGFGKKYAEEDALIEKSHDDMMDELERICEGNN